MTGAMVGDEASPPANGSSREKRDDEGYAHARRRGKRAAHGLILVVSVLFIGTSAWQLVRAVFLGDAGATESNALDPACADGLHRLTAALDRASGPIVVSASQAPAARPADVATRFRHELSPEWDVAGDVEKTCTASSAGADAWAVLARLRSAEEQLARQSRAELAPLRHDLAAHLPVELR
jgi:hypothetical protein